VGKLAALELLLKYGADSSKPDEIQMLPIHYAARMGHTNCVARLLKDHPDQVDAPSKLGWTPLALAVDGGHRETAKLLVEKGADVHRTTKHAPPCQVPMLVAITRQRVETIQLLKELGCDIDAKIAISGNVTALMLAVSKGNIDTVKLILDNGASVNITDDDGASALDWACMVDSPEILKLLLSHGKANLNVNNRRGFRPIHLAAMSGTLDCLKILVDSGAELHATVSSDATQHANKSAMAIASDRGHKEIVRYLASHY
jgi:ankyrin repeat protein